MGRRLTMGYTDRLIRNANLHYRLAHAKDVALRQFEVSKLTYPPPPPPPLCKNKH